MAGPEHHVEYSKVMKGQGYGFAVYHPEVASKLHVGAYGYFDQEGDWHKLGQVDVTLKGYPGPEKSKPFDVQVMVSNGVKDTVVKVEGGSVFHIFQFTTDFSFQRRRRATRWSRA
jgi:hypothetical protein